MNETLTPYTYDTFPKGQVWVRLKGRDTNDERLVIGVFSQGVAFLDGGAAYANLAISCDMSVDGRATWQPAGVANE